MYVILPRIFSVRDSGNLRWPSRDAIPLYEAVWEIQTNALFLVLDRSTPSVLSLTTDLHRSTRTKGGSLATLGEVKALKTKAAGDFLSSARGRVARFAASWLCDRTNIF